MRLNLRRFGNKKSISRIGLNRSMNDQSKPSVLFIDHQHWYVSQIVSFWSAKLKASDRNNRINLATNAGLLNRMTVNSLARIIVVTLWCELNHGWQEVSEANLQFSFTLFRSLNFLSCQNGSKQSEKNVKLTIEPFYMKQIVKSTKSIFIVFRENC